MEHEKVFAEVKQDISEVSGMVSVSQKNLVLEENKLLLATGCLSEAKSTLAKLSCDVDKMKRVFSASIKAVETKLKLEKAKPQLRNKICHVCQAGFITVEQLLAHCDFHDQLRPFVCTSCNAGFKSDSDLGAHQLLHEQMKFSDKTPSQDDLDVMIATQTIEEREDAMNCPMPYGFRVGLYEGPRSGIDLSQNLLDGYEDGRRTPLHHEEDETMATTQDQLM